MPATDTGRTSDRGEVTKELSQLRKLYEDLLNEGYGSGDIIVYLTTGLPPPPPPTDITVGLEVKANTAAHHTDLYDLLDLPDPPLIVRRGQPFTLNVQLSGAWRETHDLRLVFEIGDTPTESKGTRQSLLVSDKPEDGKWAAGMTKTGKETVEVSVSSPPDCIVGKWRLTVALLKKGEEKPVSRHVVEKPVYMLFNPWCKDDVVYMEGEENLQEYVLEESGCIFYGSIYEQIPRPWQFDQFQGNILDCVMVLLDRKDLAQQERGDAVKVVRKLTDQVNHIGELDNGVLSGSWSGEYEGGTQPSSWTGSAKILEEYFKTRRPVKWGQCWVFSGVLTTVCRALGIPCRSITNFASAHDNNASTTIDIHYDEEGDMMMASDSDSIWNYHCWNDVWMRRDDLPGGYGGWQACDATPQEQSEGKYQCGPCPLRAIKQGDLHLSYDASFIFAEVNGDRVNWKKQPDGSFKITDYDIGLVGQKISTRNPKVAPGAPEGQQQFIMTSDYKYPEGSPEERAAVLKAYSIARKPDKPSAYDFGPTDMVFNLQFDTSSPVGQALVVKLLCQNNSSEVRTLCGHGTIYTMLYTGVVGTKVARQDYKDLKIEPGVCGTMEVTVTPEQYRQKLEDGCHFCFTMSAIVMETKQTAIKSDVTVLKKPRLSIKAPEKGKVGEEFEVTVTFTNPMPWTLTDCTLGVEGPGITKSLDYPQSDVPAQGTFLANLKLKPKKEGRRDIVVVFSSKELDNLTGQHDIHVQA